MTSAFTGDDLDLMRSMSRNMSRRSSFASASRKGWGTGSIREAITSPGGDVFQKSGREDDEEELTWAAIERLPTYDRLRKGFLTQVLDDGKVVHEEIDVSNMGAVEKQNLIKNIQKVIDSDNERLRDRIDRVGIDVPRIEIKYQNLTIEGEALVGNRALPTLLNYTINSVEGILGALRLSLSKKRTVNILHEASGIVKPTK